MTIQPNEPVDKFDLVLCTHCKETMGTPMHKYGCPMSIYQVGMPGVTSDGYHTFNELYQYRMLYNAVLFNEWAYQDKFNVHKSIRHSDGELCFGGGWFIVVAELPTGQISNHYKLDHWDLFQIRPVAVPVAYDGHTPQVAAQRLTDLLKNWWLLGAFPEKKSDN